MKGKMQRQWSRVSNFSMDLDCGDKCMKYTIFLVNGLFALTGLVLLITGVLIHLHFLEFDSFFINEIVAPPIALIVVGCVVFVVASFGFWGSIKDNRCLLKTFALSLITLLIVQLVIGIFALVNLDEYDQFFADLLENDPDELEKIEVKLGCCGIKGPDMYNSTTLPNSCCDVFPPECTTSAPTYHDRPCAFALGSLVKENGVLIGIMVLVFAGVEVVATAMALKLSSDISKTKRRKYKNKSTISVS